MRRDFLRSNWARLSQRLLLVGLPCKGASLEYLIRVVVMMWLVLAGHGLLKACLLNGASSSVQGVWIDGTIPDYVRGAIQLAQVLRRLIQWVTVDALLLEDLIQDLPVSRMKQPLLSIVCVCALGVVRWQLMIPVDDHREQEFELAGNHCAECPLWDMFLVLLQKVLKAIVEDGLDLIYLKKLCITIEELIEGLIKDFQRDLLVLLISNGWVWGTHGVNLIHQE